MTREERKRKMPIGWSRGVVHELKNPVESGEARARELYEIYCKWLRQSWTYNHADMCVHTVEWLVSLRTLRNEMAVNKEIMYQTWFEVLWMPEFWYYPDGKLRSLGAMDASWMMWLREDQYPEWAKVEVSTGRRRTTLDPVLLKPVSDGVNIPGVPAEVLRKMLPGDRQIQSLGGFYVVRDGAAIRLDTPEEIVVGLDAVGAVAAQVGLDDDDQDEDEVEEDPEWREKLAESMRAKWVEDDRIWREQQKAIALAEGRDIKIYQTAEEITATTQAMIADNQRYWAEEDRKEAEAKARLLEEQKAEKDAAKARREQERLDKLELSKARQQRLAEQAEITLKLKQARLEKIQADAATSRELAEKLKFERKVKLEAELAQLNA